MLIQLVVEASESLLFSPPKTPGSQQGHQAFLVVRRGYLTYLMILKLAKGYYLIYYTLNRDQLLTKKKKKKKVSDVFFYYKTSSSTVFLAEIHSLGDVGWVRLV